MLRIEDYRIVPGTYFDEDEEASYFGDGVHSTMTFDSQGRLRRVRGYLGRVVPDYPRLPAITNKLRVEPLPNSEYKFVNAPLNWRDVIVEQIGGVNSSMLGMEITWLDRQRLAAFAGTTAGEPTATLWLEHYRIAPLTNVGVAKELACDGVECYITRDGQGQVVQTHAYLGQVVWVDNYLLGVREKVPQVYPMDTPTGSFITAPATWRERVLEKLTPDVQTLTDEELDRLYQ